MTSYEFPTIQLGGSVCIQLPLKWSFKETESVTGLWWCEESKSGVCVCNACVSCCREHHNVGLSDRGLMMYMAGTWVIWFSGEIRGALANVEAQLPCKQKTPTPTFAPAVPQRGTDISQCACDWLAVSSTKPKQCTWGKLWTRYNDDYAVEKRRLHLMFVVI